MVMSSAKWCPEKQIFIDGTIASSNLAQNYINSVKEKSSNLHIFGYGSLCWNPGKSVLASPSVKSRFGFAKGFIRTWAQKSADHRGTPDFNGLVCSLLTEEEFKRIKTLHVHTEQASTLENDDSTSFITEGIVYEVPPSLVDLCLKELDFREKGGYARDVIDVIVKENGEYISVMALLYRGTPDNPAFSSRALFDEVYASAVISTAAGPSGANDEYLYALDCFLKGVREAEDFTRILHLGDALTGRLSEMTKQIQKNFDVFFLYGCGSNQHDQLLLKMPTERFNNAANLFQGEEAHELKELILIVPKCGFNPSYIPKVQKVFAGGGHSALLTEEGDLYLWGCNDSFQLGRREVYLEHTLFPVIPSFGLKVSNVALGHNHTLVLEKASGHLYAFGDNRRGQVTGSRSDGEMFEAPIKLDIDEKIVDIAAGLFHSAAITQSGDILTFGCNRFGQTNMKDHNKSYGKWKPPDGSHLVRVRCGQKHTLAVDNLGRIWSSGCNKYGQLGRQTIGDKDEHMGLVDGILGQVDCDRHVKLECGWSHCTILVTESAGKKLYVFGRNDFFQLGTFAYTTQPTHVTEPTLVSDSCFNGGINITDVCCGAESTVVLDNRNRLYAVGWNEHGNLGIGHSEDSPVFTSVKGAKISVPAPEHRHTFGETIIAAGGAHFISTIQTK